MNNPIINLLKVSIKSKCLFVISMLKLLLNEYLKVYAIMLIKVHTILVIL